MNNRRPRSKPLSKFGQTGNPSLKQSAYKPRSASLVPPEDRLRAKDLAMTEGCSSGTARRLMRSGALGPVRGRNRRDRWVDRQAYNLWLDTL